MKIALVACNPVTAPYPVYPLGMSVIAAALEKAGHAVRQFDLLANGFSHDALRAFIREAAPELVGFSFRNLDNVNALNEASYIEPLAAAVRAVREATAAPVVVGGSGFSVMPERVLEVSGADYGVKGEGERTVVALAAALARGDPPPARILAETAPLAAADMPPPAYDESILSYYVAEGGVTPLQTKRGCPYRCSYCAYPVLEGHRLRPRDIEAVIDDMLALQVRGAKQVFFTDSIFNDPAGLYRGLVAALRRRAVHIPWTAFFRPEVIPPAVLADMKATGLTAIELGSDAATDTTLCGMDKAFTFQDIRAAQRCFSDAGITVSHYFMMGTPDETDATVEEGIGNILSLGGAAVFIFLGVRILPGTPLAARALEEGVIARDTDLLKPVYYFSPKISRDRLHDRLNAAFKPHRHVVYPPDRLDSGLAFLHRLGMVGMGIDELLKPRKRDR